MSHIRMLLPGFLLALLPLVTLIQGGVKNNNHSFSVDSMVPLLELERKLVDNLEEYAKALDQKLQIIRSHILAMRAENKKGQLDAISYLSNPLNGLSLIRRLHQDWVGWRKYMEQPVGAHQMRSFDTWRSELPLKEDFEDACEGIVRIQSTYDLEIPDIIGGGLHGRQYNVSMSSADIFAIGQYLFKTSRPTAAIQWLEQVDLHSQEDLLPAELSVTEEGMLQLLALAHKNKKKYSEALDLLDRGLELRPCNAALLRHHREIEALNRTSFNSSIVKDKNPERLIEMARACKPSPTNSTGLHCAYNFSTTPFLRLAPLKTELVGLKPYVVLYHDVLSPREMSLIIDMAMQKIARTGTINPNATNSKTHSRTAKARWLPKQMTGLVRRITRRIHDMTGFDLVTAEMFQVINYGIGGHYSVHKDFFNGSSEYFKTKRNFQLLGDRIATVLFYLSDVEQGGATAFSKAGHIIYPRAGTALLWYNLHTDGNGDMSTMHTACPVIVGSKWVMTEWIRERRQMFIRPCLPRERGAAPAPIPFPD